MSIRHYQATGPPTASPALSRAQDRPRAMFRRRASDALTRIARLQGGSAPVAASPSVTSAIGAPAGARALANGRAYAHGARAAIARRSAGVAATTARARGGMTSLIASGARAVSTEALKPLDTFERRHNSGTTQEVAEMCATIGFKDIDALIDATVPENIRLKKTMDMLFHLSWHLNRKMLGSVILPVQDWRYLRRHSWYMSN